MSDGLVREWLSDEWYERPVTEQERQAAELATARAYSGDGYLRYATDYTMGRRKRRGGQRR